MSVFTILFLSLFIFVASARVDGFRFVKSDVSVALEIPDEVMRRPNRAAICSALNQYPRAKSELLAFERGELSALCQPSAGKKRHRLDRCGDPASDPYSHSAYTRASRAELLKRGKVNLLIEESLREEREKLESRIEELRLSSREFCCKDDALCGQEFDRVTVSFCEPERDPHKPDPCAFGGSFRVPGRTYREVFDRLQDVVGIGEEAEEIRRLAQYNIMSRAKHENASDSYTIGSVVLSSYISRNRGSGPMEPVILHEFGHACSMVRMRVWALEHDDEIDLGRVLRATQWLDSARRRCDRDQELPTAYDDFWEELGESRELSSCLRELAIANQEGRMDRACEGVCPGHYLEEAAGIAFSLLTGDLSGGLASVFPNTCDHVRDGQHPMVSDVIECLAQNSPRFRERLKEAYECS